MQTCIRFVAALAASARRIPAAPGFFPYNNVVDRADVAALIPEEVARDVIGRLPADSATMTRFRRIPVGRNQVRFPVLTALPLAYWVTGDTGLKQTTEMAWANKFLNVEELAAIVPIPDAVVDDADFDIWGEVRPALTEAIGLALDAAVFFGANAPASFPVNIEDAAVAAGNVEVQGALAAAGGIQDDLDRAVGKVEDDGFDITGYIAPRALRGLLRRARNIQGDRLAGVNAELTEYGGDPITYALPGLWPAGAGSSLAFAGDWAQFVIGVRQDISFTVATEGVITDNTGAIVYNLFQQDMSALRVVFRAGWQVANPLTRDNPNAGTRYPVAVLQRP